MLQILRLMVLESTLPDRKGEHKNRLDENNDESVDGNMGKETRETELLSDDELEEKFDKLVSSAKRRRSIMHY